MHRFPLVALQARPGMEVQALVSWTQAEIGNGQWISCAAISERGFLPSHGFQGVLLARSPLAPSAPAAGNRKPSPEVAAMTAEARFDPRDGSLRVRAFWADGRPF